MASKNATWSAYMSAGLDRSGISQTELAGRTGKGTGTVSKWVSGQSVPDDIEIVIAVAHAFGDHDSVVALEAAGLHRAAEAIRNEISAAVEDPVIARIRRADLPDRIKEQMREDYLRREADKIRLFELEFAAAVRGAREARRRDEPSRTSAAL